MGQDADRSVLGVAEEIDRYLSHRPEAADDLTGVVTCWLKRDPDEGTLGITEVALQRLVEAGAVERRVLPDGGAIYRRSGHR